MVKIIQNYTLYEQIGEGEYGKVYRAIDCRNNKQIAVKVINAKKFKDHPKLEQCTLNEIEVLSRIDSPHIVKFVEILKTANNFYFFYEFCNGGTLEEYMKAKGPLPESTILSFLSQIVTAFGILVSNNIMHRDLKPSNILISDGVLKLADFGFCKSLEDSKDLAQTMLGSPIYMAPEIIRGQIYTIKADIWSLGVVAYQMAYGFCPFEESSIARLINLLNTEEVKFDPRINSISPALQELISKMLTKDHFKRISWAQLFQFPFSAPSSNHNNSNASFKSSTPDSKRRPLSEKSNHPNMLVPNSPPQIFFKKKTLLPDELNQSSGQRCRLLECLQIVCDLIEEQEPLCYHVAARTYWAILRECMKSPLLFSEREELCLESTLKLFEQQIQMQNVTYSGPVLTNYVEHILQSQSQNQNKSALVRCLKLLCLNDLSQNNSFEQLSLQDLHKELNYRLIRNII